MKRYEEKEVAEVKKVCVEARCDMCGRKADFPNDPDSMFEWGSISLGGGSLEYHYSIGGLWDSKELDLCYECAEWLAKAIHAKRIKRPEERGDN